MVNNRFIELLAKKLSAEIDDDELEEFKNLLANDDDCRRHYNFFKTYWVTDEEQYSNTDQMFQRIKNKIGVPEEPLSAVKKHKPAVFWYSIAAVFLLGACFILCFVIYKGNQAFTGVVKLEKTVTPIGTKSKIVLSDGSVVLLNSETSFRYPLSFRGAHNREVYLNGEAFFEVSKDHHHPFIVHTGKMSVKVLGTTFNIKSYANETSSETTLIRGAIEVTLADRPSDRIILKPNEKLILGSPSLKNKKNKRLNSLINYNPHTKYTLTNLTYFKSNDTTIVETSWTNNKLVFKDEDFYTLTNEMERWYGLKFKFKNDKLKDFPFTGIFDKEDINQALHALELIEPFKYKIKNQTVYIY
jgi:ferric-dicitrate binding protein FerR (iron transport regulator)